MKSKRRWILATIAACLPAVVFAQTGRNAKELVVNERQISAGKQRLNRDAREIGEFQQLLVDFDTARRAGAVDTYLRINTSIRAAMHREVEQARAGTRQASREVGQSRRERRSERQEANVTGSAHDYHQLRDDRRDLRDDRRDRDAAKSRVDRMDAILSRSDALQPAVRDGNLDAIAENRRLMGAFLEVMQSDLGATRTELGEDRRERREDRRERRTDRR